MSDTNISQRLYSLDALRGFDMFWIMGAEEIWHRWYKATESPVLGAIAKQFIHPDWHGFAAYDLIFPLFLFLAGVASPYSVGRALEGGESRGELVKRVVKRGLLLVLLGVVFNHGFSQLLPLSEVRFPSVLGRIGLAWMFANLIYLYSGRRAQVAWCGGLLIGYWLLLKFTAAPGFAAGDLSMEGNIASYIDRLLIPGKLYLGIHDPEGLVSTLPSISTGLLGILTGTFIQHGAYSKDKKAAYMALAGVVLIALAQLWSLDFPINKNLWTSSFALQVGGFSLLLLALFYYIIDAKGYQRWAFFFKVIGMNSILIYMSGVFIDWEYTTEATFGWLGPLLGPVAGPVVLVLCYLLIKWLFLKFLYDRKIFLRV